MTEIALPSDEVHVYWARTQDWVSRPRMHAAMKAMLSDEELDRCARFRFQRDRDTFVVAHAMLRDLIARALRVAPDGVRFDVGEFGKPELSQAPSDATRLRFNLTHTHGLVACALAFGPDLGVDVEQLSRKVEIDGVARSVFSERERAGLSARRGDDKRERFFELWTLKEAYVKAVGRGIGMGLRAITFEPEGSRPRVQFDAPLTDRPERWGFSLHRPTDDHVLAVARADHGHVVPQILRWQMAP